MSSTREQYITCKFVTRNRSNFNPFLTGNKSFLLHWFPRRFDRVWYLLSLYYFGKNNSLESVLHRSLRHLSQELYSIFQKNVWFSWGRVRFPTIFPSRKLVKNRMKTVKMSKKDNNWTITHSTLHVFGKKSLSATWVAIYKAKQCGFMQSSNFRSSVGKTFPDWFGVALLRCYWSEKLAPLYQPIGFKSGLVSTWSVAFSRAPNYLLGYTLSLHWFLVIFSFPLIGTEWRSRSRTVLQQIISKHQSMCLCNLTVVSSAILNCYAVVLLPDSRFPVLRPSFPVPNFKNISSVAT